MTPEDWERVIDQAAALGVETVQYIGGEPTLDPDLPRLVRYALATRGPQPTSAKQCGAASRCGPALLKP